MNEALQNIITDHVGELLTLGITLLSAYLKKKLDLRKLRKQGKLND